MIYMTTLEKIHETINTVAKDPQVHITKIDDFTFNVVVGGNLMTAFEKLGTVQKQIDESCSDEYTLKTIYGDGQDAKLILKKN